MKRWLGGLLAALTLLSLTACGLAAVDEGDIADVPPAGAEEKTDLPIAPPEDMEAPSGPEDADPGISDGGFSSSWMRSDLPEIVEPGPAEALPAEPDAAPDSQEAEPAPLPEDGTYTSKEDVALYIHFYGCLPGNFITKREARSLGWSGGSLEPYAPGKCIGGDRFGNYEGLLPEAGGREYTECDIDTLGAGSRGAKRIVFSNDGLIYYTGDHYESFDLLYGDEGDG